MKRTWFSQLVQYFNNTAYPHIKLTDNIVVRKNNIRRIIFSQPARQKNDSRVVKMYDTIADADSMITFIIVAPNERNKYDLPVMGYTDPLDKNDENYISLFTKQLSWDCHTWLYKQCNVCTPQYNIYLKFGIGQDFNYARSIEYFHRRPIKGDYFLNVRMPRFISYLLRTYAAYQTRKEKKAQREQYKLQSLEDIKFMDEIKSGKFKNEIKEMASTITGQEQQKDKNNE